MAFIITVNEMASRDDQDVLTAFGPYATQQEARDNVVAAVVKVVDCAERLESDSITLDEFTSSVAEEVLDNEVMDGDEYLTTYSDYIEIRVMKLGKVGA